MGFARVLLVVEQERSMCEKLKLPPRLNSIHVHPNGEGYADRYHCGC